MGDVSLQNKRKRMERQEVQFQDLGRIGYQAAWDYQEQLLQQNLGIKVRQRTGSPNEPVPWTTHHLLFCEHPPVYTLGKSGKEEHVLIPADERDRLGIEYVPTNRGGDITFHGPGQLVGYPILDLERMYTDIGRYLRELEEVIIQALAQFGIQGGRSAGETGVWLDPNDPARARKICAMGVKCSRWVTMHGIGFNVNTDLNYLNHIIPCGIVNKQVTSLQAELGREIDMDGVKKHFKAAFQKVYDIEFISE
jgi:lipoyl(octanoyl) transferase